jgi:hypothetical protein
LKLCRTWLVLKDLACSNSGEEANNIGKKRRFSLLLGSDDPTLYDGASMMVYRFCVCDLKTFLSFLFILLVFVSISLLASPAQAVAISSGDGLGNTTAEIDDFGFANVGVCSGGSAVYLGYGWVITAAHVPTANVLFNDQSYGYNPDSVSYLANPSELGLSGSPDLKLFQLIDVPHLPALDIATESAPFGSQVSMAGNGLDRTGEGLNSWQWDNGTWIESTSTVHFTGYDLASSRTVRWGTNETVRNGAEFPSEDSMVLSNGEVETLSYKVTFQGEDGLEDECQGVLGDSGGGVFFKNEDEWELAGIMIGTSKFPGQPYDVAACSTATYIADLSYYQDQISDIILPIPGDANLDNMVNTNDIASVVANWQKVGTCWIEGDFNGDCIVNTADLAALAAHWQVGVFGSTTAIPEPSAGILLLAVFLFLGLFSRIKSR